MPGRFRSFLRAVATSSCFVLAGLNALYFHLTLFKTVEEWEGDPIGPLAARVAGVASLALWAGVIITGRMIAYDAFVPAWWIALELE